MVHLHQSGETLFVLVTEDLLQLRQLIIGIEVNEAAQECAL